jgi:16S rRNA (guanine(966)-N(2))-methyltransferase RsmD
VLNGGFFNGCFTAKNKKHLTKPLCSWDNINVLWANYLLSYFLILVLVILMRVITGSCRGKFLKTLDGNDVRPTSQKVKEAVFSAIQFDIEGRRVLDLFAGSGQLGIEALSRGAKNAVFVDNNASSIKIIKQNIESTGLESQAKVYSSDYSTFTATSRDVFDIVFLDPPYQKGLLLPALKSVLPLMSDYGIIICEYPPEIQLPAEIGGFAISKTYRYGKINVSIFRKGAKD